MKQSRLNQNKPLKVKKPLKASQPLKQAAPLSTSPSKSKPRKRLPLERKPLPQLRKEADKWFSWYVRLRDSVREGDKWKGGCITCSKNGVVVWLDDGKLRFTTGWNNGHFVGRDNWVVRYEEENNNLQCSFRCNNMRSGEYVKYKAALRIKYGEDVPEKLEKMAEEQPSHTYHHSREELLEIIHNCKVAIDFYTNNVLHSKQAKD